MLKLTKKKTGKLRSELDKYTQSQPQISFNSLTKSKTNPIYQSEVSSRPYPPSPMLSSQLRTRIQSVNKENIKDEYQLFTNIIKSKREPNVEEAKQEPKDSVCNMKRKSHFLKVKTEYCGDWSQLKSTTRKRSSSKHSV